MWQKRQLLAETQRLMAMPLMAVLLHRELRLIEALTDPPICDEILTYKVHAEREGSLRYAKGTSETMATLQGLV